jgi:hypothetical protein
VSEKAQSESVVKVGKYIKQKFSNFNCAEDTHVWDAKIITDARHL